MAGPPENSKRPRLSPSELAARRSVPLLSRQARLCVLQPPRKSETKLVRQFEVQPTLQSEVQSESQSVPQPKIKVKVLSDLQSGVQRALHSDVKPMRQPELVHQSQLQPKIKLEIQSVLQPEVQHALQPEIEPVQQPELQSVHQSQHQPKIKLEIQSVLQPEVQHALQPEIEPVQQPELQSVHQSQLQPKIKVKVLSDLQPKLQPEIQAEVSPELQRNIKLEIQPELQCGLFQLQMAGSPPPPAPSLAGSPSPSRAAEGNAGVTTRVLEELKVKNAALEQQVGILRKANEKLRIERNYAVRKSSVVESQINVLQKILRDVKELRSTWERDQARYEMEAARLASCLAEAEKGRIAAEENAQAANETIWVLSNKLSKTKVRVRNQVKQLTHLHGSFRSRKKQLASLTWKAPAILEGIPKNGPKEGGLVPKAAWSPLQSSDCREYGSYASEKDVSFKITGATAATTVVKVEDAQGWTATAASARVKVEDAQEWTATAASARVKVEDAQEWTATALTAPVKIEDAQGWTATASAATVTALAETDLVPRVRSAGSKQTAATARNMSALAGQAAAGSVPSMAGAFRPGVADASTGAPNFPSLPGGTAALSGHGTAYAEGSIFRTKQPSSCLPAVQGMQRDDPQDGWCSRGKRHLASREDECDKVLPQKRSERISYKIQVLRRR